MPESTAPALRRRRIWKFAAALGLLVIALVVGLPSLLSTPPARLRIERGINRALAPGSVRFEGIRLSWTGPTRLERFSLVDPRGKVVARAPAAVLDLTFGRLVFGGPGAATLLLDRAALDIERSPGGTIDLADALRTVIATPDPMRDLTIRIEGGTLRYADPFLAEPVRADRLDLNLRIPQAPHPLAWDLALADGRASLAIKGDFDRWQADGPTARAGDLRIGVVGKGWPFHARVGGIDATARLDGTADVDRKRGRWNLSGDAGLLDLVAQGGPLRGDVASLGRVVAAWDVAEADRGWSIRRLALSSGLGELKADGQLGGPDGLGKQRIDGRIDLAAVARMLPHALGLTEGLVVDRGSARVGVEIRAEAARTAIDVEATVADLAARSHGRALAVRDPATLTALLIREGGASRVDRLAVKTSFGDASARGRLDGEGVRLEAQLDLDGLRRQADEWVDLGGLDLAGRARVDATYKVIQGRFEATAATEVRDLRVAGPGRSPIRRDLARFGTTLAGPAEGSGLPRAWDRLALDLHAGPSTALIEAKKANSTVSLSGRVGSPVTWRDQTRTIEATATGEWSSSGRELAIDRLDARILPQPEGRPDAPFGLAARGKLDLDRGELQLGPIAGRPATDALAPAPEGIRIAGIGAGLDQLRVDGGLSGSLGALDRLVSDWSGRAPLGLDGRWTAAATARGDGEGFQVAGKLGLDPPGGAAPAADRPESVAFRAAYASGPDQLAIQEFTVATRYGTLDASGRVDDPSGAVRVDLRGRVAPDFARLTALMASRIEPGAKLEGRPRDFRLAGTLGRGEGSGPKRDLEAEVGFDLVELDIYGMKVGPAPVVLRASGGKARFEPISTTLNEGHIRLEPELDLDDPAGLTLRLGKNSTVRDARINDEVSHRVLAFAAPILDRAAIASGRINVDLDHAEIPLGAGRRKQLRVEGAVVFEDVEFAPGPLADQLLGVIGRPAARLKLDRPVALTIADGRVNQRGLAIPIGDLTRIDLAGWVDFDRNLAITAALPVTPAMLGNNPLLADIAAGTSIRVPISGTLDRPTIDKDAFGAGLKEMGQSLLTRGATRGAMELLQRLAGPRDPNAPPPLTPEERRERRMERKADRLERRSGGGDPDPRP